jgi:hypothetical protein
MFLFARIVHCVAGCIWLAVPQPTEWQRAGNQINAATIFARADLVNVCRNRWWHTRRVIYHPAIIGDSSAICEAGAADWGNAMA